jgi:peptidoglycan/xylan/chitin deacetylase (PgdA/CDA1 family)
MVRIRLLAALAALTALLLTIYLEPRWLLDRVARNSPDVLYFVRTQEKVVALTIDDVPHPAVTPRILDVLRENGARATFFVIGDHAAGNQAILERIRQEGSELGNHLNHEYPSIRLTPTEFDQELRAVDSVIRPATATKWFRPGSGWYNDRMLSQARRQGYRCALGSVYPFDTVLPNERLTAWYIRSQVFPGAIIILHDGKEDRMRTARVLATVLPDLKRSGYRVVTLSELDARRSTR